MNDLIAANRSNKYAGAELKKKTQNAIKSSLYRQARGVQFDKKVNVKIHFYEPDRRRDEDNVLSGMKFILDALQEMNVIKNDNQRWLHISDNQVFVDPKNPRIEIDLEEIGGE